MTMASLQKLPLVCEHCGEVASEWSSRRVDSAKRCNPFEVNILASRAMLSTGNDQTAMNDIFAAMGLSGRAMHKKTSGSPEKHPTACCHASSRDRDAEVRA